MSGMGRFGTTGRDAENLFEESAPMSGDNGGPRDDEIQREVSERLFSDPQIDLDASIVVSAHEGEVTLRGTVPTFGAKRAARSVARHVAGVTSVKDELEVAGPPGEDLDRMVRDALRDIAHLPATIEATVNEGTVTLTGWAPREIESDAAGFVARNVPGVVGVDNLIEVSSDRRHAEDLDDSIGRALDRLARIEADGSAGGGRVELRERLASALRSVERIRSDAEASGNEVEFHLARYIESLESAVADATARLAAAGEDGSFEWSILERDVTALEAEVVVAQEKLDAALAEERGDLRGEVGAQIHAARAEVREIKAELNQPRRVNGGSS